VHRSFFSSGKAGAPRLVERPEWTAAPCLKIRSSFGLPLLATVSFRLVSFGGLGYFAL
jgi:hypothetical protein